MPPPGPPQGGPPPSPDAPPQDGDSSGGGAISKLLMNVDQAIDHLNQVIGQSKAASPEEKQLMATIDQLFGKLLDSLGVSGGGDEGQDQASGPGAQGQTVPPEAGGNKNAVPAGM